MAKYKNEIGKFLDITKAISDISRVRVLMMLCGGELCVCQIVEMLGLAPSTVSKHMSILRQAGLVVSRKSGKWIYYSLSTDSDAVSAIDWLKNSLKADSLVNADKLRLEEIKKLDKESLCGSHTKKDKG